MAAGRASEGGEVLWRPPAERMAASNLARYLSWLAEHRCVRFATYDEVWRWSVDDLEGFWGSIWEYFGVSSTAPYERVLAEPAMPGAVWFPGARLNYAEGALARRDDHPAIIFASETAAPETISYASLATHVAAAAAGLRRLGVGRGDQVAAYLPNIPQAVVGLLATAAIGAVWSSCAPEFGVRAVVDRFRQIEPTVLLAADGYRYGGRAVDRRAEVQAIAGQLPSLQAVVAVSVLGGWADEAVVTWEELVAGDPGEPTFEQVGFDHPLWILYSSGTTGPPKAIVQGHGGIWLEHVKALSLHLDLGPADRFFWYSTTGWMMWNFLVSGLLVGATIVLYDGAPGHPDLLALWRLAADAGATYFGTSAPLLLACRKAGIRPGEACDLSHLRSVGSTGAPLPAEGFRWVYDAVADDIALGSVSGGTDLCTAFVGSCPLLAVRAGEIQCRMLGAAVEAWDASGKPVVGTTGELVLTRPLPSMPLGLWNDPDGRRYRESYFEPWPGVWRHGDWLTITPSGGCIISGRSDATLNRGGVRAGTAEFYAVIEDLAEVTDALVVDTGGLDSPGELLAFVVLAPGVSLDEALAARIRERLRVEMSPRHAPDRVIQIPRVPRTVNGKRLEVPARRVLLGAAVDEVIGDADPANREALAAMFTAARAAGVPAARPSDTSL